MAAPARILVTGAGGFVGRSLLPALRAAFPAAVLIGAGRRPAIPGTDESLHLDLLDHGSMTGAIAAVRPDAVLHLAAQADVAASFRAPDETWRPNLLGTLALAEAVLREAPEAAFLYVSSGEIYGLGFQAGQPLDEDAAFQPANPYAASKAAADLAIGEMALRGLRAIRLRPFTHVGPGQAPQFAVANFARQVCRIEAGQQEPVLRTGALDRWRDLLDVRDICAGYVRALELAERLPPGLALNLCGGTPRRIGDILDALLALAGVEARIEQEAVRLRPTDVERVQGDPRRAREILGWAPTIPWEETLRSVLADWRSRVAAGE
ncbi:GDP-mannose 4,6-dehydratase [Belnapia sp. T18]|uniref:GDP-mannose 4,6-dehydratase n=1 Tax=Belnapia arida TaxID=2804533 RepID=A0ABS1U344_9PROT|nr:GDP-mannose 4,6-dehydratase [Belnapia arida]MBL6079082.1 GDP-mannose 4,6-dehydratase [Belnapia arida]